MKLRKGYNRTIFACIALLFAAVLASCTPADNNGTDNSTNYGTDNSQDSSGGYKRNNLSGSQEDEESNGLLSNLFGS